MSSIDDGLLRCRLDVGAGLGQRQRLDAVGGQVGRGEVGADLKAVVPPREEEVGVLRDQLLQGEVAGGDLVDRLLDEPGRELGREGLPGGQAAAGGELADHVRPQAERDHVLGRVDVVGYRPGRRRGEGDEACRSWRWSPRPNSAAGRGRQTAGTGGTEAAAVLAAVGLEAALGVELELPHAVSSAADGDGGMRRSDQRGSYEGPGPIGTRARECDATGSPSGRCCNGSASPGAVGPRRPTGLSEIR